MSKLFVPLVVLQSLLGIFAGAYIALRPASVVEKSIPRTIAAPEYVLEMAGLICENFAEAATELRGELVECLGVTVVERFQTAGPEGFFIMTHHGQGDMGFVLFFRGEQLLAVYPE